MNDVSEFLNAIDHDTRRRDALRLDEIFRDVTGWQPKLMGKMVAYGTYDYTYESGHSGTSLATGFAPQKARQTLYIMPGYSDFDHILARIGKHKLGKSCLYINKLADVDEDVVAEIIRAGLDDLATRWTITPT